MPREVNEPQTIGERMTAEQLAASAYRAATYASQGEPATWGLLPEGDRQSWLRVAEQADAILTANDGKSYADAGLLLMAAFHPMLDGAGYPPTYKLAWEAAARHLTQLLDDDEIEDLPALEQSWREWAAKRLQTVEKQT